MTGRNIIAALEHPKLFAPFFEPLETWRHGWYAFLKCFFGLPLSPEEFEIYQRCTGRIQCPPAGGFLEAWLCCGRRSGKSRILALIAVWLAMTSDFRKSLAVGEWATIQILAADRKQSRAIFNFVRGLLHNVPTLKAHFFQSETADRIELQNRVQIEITTASYRGIRGYSALAILCDEIAFWQSGDTAANPDHEILAAAKPSLASIEGSRLVVATSPYAPRGELYRAAKRLEGEENTRAVFWRAPTRLMNPTIQQDVIDEAMAVDPERAESEWGARFRSDISTFLDREVIEACVDAGVAERPPEPGHTYYAACDPAGGGGQDAYTLAIAHLDKGQVVIDVLREARPPFDPYVITEAYAGLLTNYRVRRVQGDKYAGEWPALAFQRHSVLYQAAGMPKSEYYVNALPLFMKTGIRLLDNPRLVDQLANLERRTSRAGKDSIDHPPGQHDDLANVVALAAFPGVQKRNRTRVIGDFFGRPYVVSDTNDSPEQRAERRRYAEMRQSGARKMRSVWLGKPNPNINY